MGGNSATSDLKYIVINEHDEIITKHALAHTCIIRISCYEDQHMQMLGLVYQSEVTLPKSAYQKPLLILVQILPSSSLSMKSILCETSSCTASM